MRNLLICSLIVLSAFTFVQACDPNQNGCTSSSCTSGSPMGVFRGMPSAKMFTVIPLSGQATESK